MAEIFVSYSRAQRDRIKSIVQKLELFKVSVWYDASLRSGESFSEEIKRELSESKAVLVCWDRKAISSDYVTGEAMIARTTNKYVPCFLESVDLHAPFNVVQTEDLSNWQGEDSFAAWLKILERIGILIGRPGLSAYAQIVGEGGRQKPLRDWAKAFPEDPLTPEVLQRIGILETESASDRVRRERRESKAREHQRKQARRMARRSQISVRTRTMSGMATGIGLLAAVALLMGLAAYVQNTVKIVEGYLGGIELTAFEARRASDLQGNRLNQQELALRRAYNEARAIAFADDVTLLAAGSPLEAAEKFIRLGTDSFATQRIISRAARESVDNAEGALYRGAAALVDWSRSGEFVSDKNSLPALLQAAKTEFEKVTEDADLAPLGHSGLAWVYFEVAKSNSSNYALADCQAVFSEVALSAYQDQIGPLQLYWAAQCSRKLGNSGDAVLNYSLALRQSLKEADSGSGLFGDDAVATLEMNAFHGLGTAIISAEDIPDSDEISAARSLATEVCGPISEQDGSPNMILARACLNRATQRRTLLGQTPNQIGGTRENISFSYLRDRDFAAALKNAKKVADTGLFAWNELVIAISANHVGDAEAERSARQNIALFRVPNFNLCEVEKLLDASLFAEALEIVKSEHSETIAPCK